MELQIQVPLPGLQVPGSMVFGYPTRLVDAWVPAVERVQLPAFRVPECTATVSVEARSTGSHAGVARRPRGPWRKLRRSLSRIGQARKRPMHLGDRLVYDARWKDQGNIAHIIHHVLARLELARKVLAEPLGRRPDILVLLPVRPPKLAVDVYRFTGIETVCTDGSVDANVVSIDCDPFYGLLPLLSNFEIPAYEADTPRRLFISRRKNRLLINEDEIRALLEDRGFASFYFENIPLNRQWSLLRNATDVVAIHGAALGALAFHRGANANVPSFRVTELFGAGFVVDVFRRYAAVLKGSWVGVRGRITPAIVQDLDVRGANFRHAFEPFEIDPECLELALQWHGASTFREV